MTFAPKNVSILRFQCGHQCMREGGVTCHLEHRHYRIDNYHDHEHNISVCFFFWGGGAHLGHTISPPKYIYLPFIFLPCHHGSCWQQNFRQWQMGLKFLQLLTECLKPTVVSFSAAISCCTWAWETRELHQIWEGWVGEQIYHESMVVLCSCHRWIDMNLW